MRISVLEGDPEMGRMLAQLLVTVRGAGYRFELDVEAPAAPGRASVAV